MRLLSTSSSAWYVQTLRCGWGGLPSARRRPRCLRLPTHRASRFDGLGLFYQAPWRTSAWLRCLCLVAASGAFFRSWTPSSGRWSAAPLGPGRSCSDRGLRRELCSWGCLLRPATARESEEGVAHRNLLHGILAVFFFRFDGIMTAVEPASSSSPGGTSARRPATAT